MMGKDKQASKPPIEQSESTTGATGGSTGPGVNATAQPAPTTTSPTSAESTFAALESSVTSALSSLGGYVTDAAGYAAVAAVVATAGTDEEQAEVWSELTGDAPAEAPKKAGERKLHEEEVWLVPYWGVRRDLPDGTSQVAVNVHAVALDLRPLRSATRTQRALVGIARRFAALPGDVPESSAPSDDEQSETGAATPPAAAAEATPPTPTSSTPRKTASRLRAALPSLRRKNADRILQAAGHPESPSHAPDPQVSPTEAKFQNSADLARAHEILDKRLAPFWAGELAGRDVRLEVYPAPRQEPLGEPMAVETCKTDASGIISKEFVVPAPQGVEGVLVRAVLLEDMKAREAKEKKEKKDREAQEQKERKAKEARAKKEEKERQVKAKKEEKERLAQEKKDQAQAKKDEKARAAQAKKDAKKKSKQQEGSKENEQDEAEVEDITRSESEEEDGTQEPDAKRRRQTGPEDTSADAHADTHADAHADAKAEAADPAPADAALTPTKVHPAPPAEVYSTSLVIPISRADGVRIISDMDDTVKVSDILGGAREVFRNVFCRPSEEICVEGMNTLYQRLSPNLSGVHFVSNSPYELLPAISDFLTVNHFPASSLILKYYGPRGILGALFQGAGERKRPGLEEVLGAFPTSTFLLFGDSGEQDLEIYTLMATERPHQVRGIFIRDVTTGRAGFGGATPTVGVRARARLVDGPPIPGAYPMFEDEEMPSEEDAGEAPDVCDEAPEGPTSSVRFAQADVEDIHDDEPPPAAASSSVPPPADRTISTDTSTDTPSPAPGIKRTTTSASETTESTLDEMKTVAGLKALTAEQENLHHMAAMWEQRLANARAALPKGILLCVFTDPAEIEDVATRLSQGLDVDPAQVAAAGADVGAGQGDKVAQAALEVDTKVDQAVGEAEGVKSVAEGAAETVKEAAVGS